MNYKTANQKMLTAGKILRARRNELNLSLEQVSQETKIQQRYLELLEEDRYDQFENNVFISGFVKIYSDFLGLNVDKIYALYRRSLKEQERSQPVKKGLKLNLASLLTPYNVALTVIALLILSFIGYFSYQYYLFQRPPQLTITQPEQNSTVTQDRATVSGRTEDETKVELNGELVSLDSQNRFEEEIQLVEGNNTITIRATKTNNEGSQTVKIINLTYKPETEPESTEPEPQPEPTVEKFTIEVKISGSEAWVQLLVDGNQELAQVLQSGFSQQFEAEKDIVLVTGRLDSTQVLINGGVATLGINRDTGVARLECELKENKVSCN